MISSPNSPASAERFAMLRLIRSENVGPITVRQLLARFGTAEAALAALPDLARRGGRKRPIKIASRDDAERELAALAACGAEPLAITDKTYPRALAAIPDAPPVLAVLGHGHLLERRAVAVVGARNASANGRRLAERLATDLGQSGYLVFSGLARGIDAAAHRGALASGTAAVVAGGVDVVYPEENRALYDDIKESGLVLSEMPPGTEPQARHFPRRNRIISGLSLGVLVVEAAPRSGSLITARLGLEQNREIFAVPGSPLDPRARGCNHLIRQGATLVESAQDVLEVLESMIKTPLEEPDTPEFEPGTPQLPPESELEAGREKVLELLGPSPVMVDEVIRQCQLSPAVVNLVLLELELAGRLERHPGNRVSLITEATGEAT
jgi:DNA processing protein